MKHLIILFTSFQLLAGEVNLVCLNVNHENANIEKTIEILIANEPDLILLQETTPEFEKRARSKLQENYRHMWFSHGKTKTAQGFSS